MAWSAVAPWATDMFAGWARSGALFVLFTVMLNDLLSNSVPSDALTVAPAVPALVKPGTRRIVPVVAVLFWTERYPGPSTTANVSGSASGSDPVMVCSAVEPSFTVISAGWARGGGGAGVVMVGW